MHLSSAYAVENPRLKKNEKKTADMVQTNMLAFMKSFCQQPELNHIKSNRRYLRYALASAIKEVKPGNGENGHAREG